MTADNLFLPIEASTSISLPATLRQSHPSSPFPTDTVPRKKVRFTSSMNHFRRPRPGAEGTVETPARRRSFNFREKLGRLTPHRGQGNPFVQKRDAERNIWAVLGYWIKHI